MHGSIPSLTTLKYGCFSPISALFLDKICLGLNWFEHFLNTFFLSALPLVTLLCILDI